MAPKTFINRRLVILLGAAFLVKLLVLLLLLHINKEALFSPDSASYIGPALDLLAHGTFTNNGAPVLFRTPGYSLFLTPVIYLFGAERLYIAVVLQSLLLLLTAYLVYAMLRTRCNEKNCALAAVVLLLLDPTLFVAEFSLVSEMLYTTTITLAMFLLSRHTATRKWYYLLLGVFLISLSAYIRPIALYLAYPICLCLAIRAILARDRTGILLVLVALLVNVLVLRIWETRNENIFQERIFSSVKGRNLYRYNAAAVYARANGKKYEDVKETFAADKVSENEAVQARYDEEAGTRILLRYPLSTAYITTKGLLVNLFDPGTGALANLFALRQSGSGIIYKFHDLSLPDFVRYLVEHEKVLLISTALGLFWITFLWLCATSGLARAARAMTIFDVLLLCLIAYHLLLSAGPASTFRFRTPVVPFLVMFAARGFCQLKARFRSVS